MAPPSDDVYTKISTDAATEFVQTFYPALQSNRAMIASFYGTPASTIMFNGNAVADGHAVQDIFVNQMPPSHYEVQSFDCQIINKQFPTPTTRPLDPRKDISILVMVSGYVRFGESRDLPQRGFNETIILVPNPSTEPKGKRKRDWLIQTQNFRLVV
ncbi:hypothetical protein BJX99DRAFT_231344 [Aspergillus californicus]